MNPNENPNGAAKKTHQQFSNELNHLCVDSANQGVPLEVIVMELEIAKLFIFQRINFDVAQRAAAAAQREKSPIITPSRL